MSQIASAASTARALNLLRELNLPLQKMRFLTAANKA